ncbi:T9SS-dependent choice-of-anchor J family protein [Pontibacter sp. 13R65]|uniref:T9SS-dependent choice-of-anchor J family protein n=1 Tax=Pontibacter sp. 13R65 TaxID=3127458 RepID=UPI00301BB8D8
MFRHLQKLGALALLGCCLGSSDALGQILVKNGSTQEENFNTIGRTATATLPSGWKVSKSGTVRTVVPFGEAAVVTATERAGGANMASNAGNGIYNFAGTEGTDQAIGFLSSGSATKSGNLYAHFRNEDAVSIEGLDISYTIEKYRRGTNAAGYSVQLYYSLNGTSWTSAGSNFATSFPADEVTEGYAVAPGDVKRIDNQKLEIEIPAGSDFYLAWSYSVTSGATTSFAQALAIDDIKVSFASSSSTEPGLTAPNSVALGDVVTGSTATTSYVLAPRNISSPVTVTVAGDFEISKSETGGFAKELTFAADELAANQTVYVRIGATVVGPLSGTITHSSAEFNPVSVAVSATGVSPYSQNFNNCANGVTNMPGGWMQYSVTGEQVWNCTTFGRPNSDGVNTNGVNINGYSGAARENEDWLISPVLDLAGFEHAPVLTFWSRAEFNGPGLKLMVSTDFSGTGNPKDATWTELNGYFPEANANAWTLSTVDLSAYKQGEVYVAFVYTSKAEANQAARWTLDDVDVTDAENIFITSNLDFDFGVVEMPNVSEPRTFTFKGIGQDEDVVVSVAGDYEISKDGETFVKSLTYTATEAAQDQTVFIRFVPSEAALVLSGSLTFTSGDYTETKGSLSGSSLARNNTLDIVTWNMEWFGSSSTGPSDVELQYQNAKKVMQTLNADIFAFQEVSNDDLMRQLVGEMEGYDYVNSEVYSYSQKEGSGTLDPQKLYIVYKEDVVTVKSEKVLLNKLYQDILAGQTLPNYPSSSDSFWASGRLPYMVQVDAVMNGVAQRLHLVNIHARANSGTDVSRYNMRDYDVKVLKDSLDAQYPNVNLVLLGDFNDDVDISVVNNLPSSYKVFVDDTEKYKAITYDLSTTGAYTYASGAYQSFLDHILISNPLADEYVDQSIKIENQFLTSIPSFRRTTSDHLPLSARFTFTNTPTVSFTTATATATEGEAVPTAVTLTLSEAQQKDHTVTLALNSETSTANGADFTTSPALASGKVTVTVPANETSLKFDVTVVDDAQTEGEEVANFFIERVSTDLGILVANSTFTLTIIDNNVTSTAEAAKGMFQVYPNPAAGNQELRFSLPEHVAALPKVSLSVWSVDGRKVFEAAGSQESVQKSLNAKLANTPNGMFIIKVEAGKELFQAKVMKQ